MAVYSDAELHDTINAYFTLLSADLAGRAINKKQVYRDLQNKYDHVRSLGSYESKMQNIGAVMESIGLPYVKGLKPRGNAGSKLRLLIKGIAIERGLISVAC